MNECVWIKEIQLETDRFVRDDVRMVTHHLPLNQKEQSIPSFSISLLHDIDWGFKALGGHRQNILE